MVSLCPFSFKATEHILVFPRHQRSQDPEAQPWFSMYSQDRTPHGMLLREYRKNFLIMICSEVGFWKGVWKEKSKGRKHGALSVRMLIREQILGGRHGLLGKNEEGGAQRGEQCFRWLVLPTSLPYFPNDEIISSNKS